MRYGIPVLELGSGVLLRRGVLDAMQSHVRLQLPGGPCGHCLGVPMVGLEDPWLGEFKDQVGYVEDQDGDIVESPGAVATLNAMAAGMAAVIVRRFFCQELGDTEPLPRHLVWDEAAMRVYDLSDSFPAKADCPFCGEGRADGVWMRGDTLAPELLAPVAPTDADSPLDPGSVDPEIEAALQEALHVRP
jgi:hypothetical protein